MDRIELRSISKFSIPATSANLLGTINTTKNMAPLTTEQLCTGMAKLPQELFDQIYDLTFATYEVPSYMIIDYGYKPPFQLQINHKMRKQYFEVYYGKEKPWLVRARGDGAYDDLFATRVVRSAEYHNTQDCEERYRVRRSIGALLRRWLRSLSDEALALVTRGTELQRRHRGFDDMLRIQRRGDYGKMYDVCWKAHCGIWFEKAWDVLEIIEVCPDADEGLYQERGWRLCGEDGKPIPGMAGLPILGLSGRPIRGIHWGVDQDSATKKSRIVVESGR